MKYFAFLPVVLAIAACENSGASYSPIVDGPKGANYQNDLAECQALAASKPIVDGDTTGAVAVGVAGGAATSAIINDSSDDLGRAAAVGALAAITADAVSKTEARKNIVINCMRGRGHNVIG